MKEINEYILLQYINQTLSASDKKEVDEWLAASPGHQKQLEQLYFTWMLTEKLQVMREVNPDKALLRFKSDLKHKKNKQQIKLWINRCQRIAAILFIPVLLLAGYFYMQDQKVTTQSVLVRANPGMTTTVDLPDGSKVWLNANSELEFPNNFSSDKRIVRLNGEGFFDVVKDASKPFIVKAGHAYEVEVLGTSFNVAAYADSDIIETTLVEGAVALNVITSSGNQISQRLQPDEKAIYEIREGKMEIKSVNTEFDTAWMHGELIFRNQSMDQVLKTLERYYHVKFKIQNESVLQSVITARFKNEQLPQILDYLKLASGFVYTIHKNENQTNEPDLYIIESLN